jgi:hypothetical protein
MYVQFITDEHFKNCVRHVLNAYSNAISLKESIEESIKNGNIFQSLLFKNIVDPFKMAFDVNKIGIEEWIKKEVLRQLDKSVEQRMGEFHQKILGGVEGWTDLGIGKEVDLMKNDKSIYIEIKNKYNTCSSDALSAVRRKLEEITRNKHDAIACWAYIIAKTNQKSGEEVWVKTKFNKIDSVKKVWGEKVYQIVTGDKDALEKIYNALPTVILDVIEEDEIIETETIINELIGLLKPHLGSIKSQIYSEVFK